MKFTYLTMLLSILFFFFFSFSAAQDQTETSTLGGNVQRSLGMTEESDIFCIMYSKGLTMTIVTLVKNVNNALDNRLEAVEPSSQIIMENLINHVTNLLANYFTLTIENSAVSVCVTHP